MNCSASNKPVSTSPRVMPQDRGEMPCGKTTFRWGERTYLMGVVNVTPDSFSGDGLVDDPAAALELALRMESAGADVIDVGGESTRPPGLVYGRGATPIGLEEELCRVLPVVERLAARLRIPISVDTYKPQVARAVLEAGASMINDVWGLKADAELARVAAQYQVPLVLMHNQRSHHYDNLVPDVMASLRRGVDIALAAGVADNHIILDPGIGFGKTADHNLELLGRLGELRSLGCPLLVGTSRKSTIGLILDLPVDQRLEGTAATVALSIASGADLVRVHDVKEMSRVLRVADAIVRGWRPVQWYG